MRQILKPYYHIPSESKVTVRFSLNGELHQHIHCNPRQIPNQLSDNIVGKTDFHYFRTLIYATQRISNIEKNWYSHHSENPKLHKSKFSHHFLELLCNMMAVSEGDIGSPSNGTKKHFLSFFFLISPNVRPLLTWIMGESARRRRACWAAQPPRRWWRRSSRRCGRAARAAWS